RYSFANANDGSVTLDPDGPGAAIGISIAYTGLDPITSSITANTVELTYTGGSETITVTNPGSGNTTVDSTLGETVTFANPTDLLKLTATGGADTINVTSLASGYTAVQIAGDDANDVVNFNGSVTLA